MTAAVGVTAIVTAFDRLDETVSTLHRLLACDPPPAEVLVHVDANRVACAQAVAAAHPSVGVVVSEQRVGPGGGRNRLMATATQAIVASFDDDSYPIDTSYFARVVDLFARFPEASVIDATVFHLGEPLVSEAQTATWVADFSGGACAYRRDHYLAAGGYVPLATAYGMEEVDLALRLHAQGRRILRTRWLRVYHDTDRARHADPEVTAASIANIALLTYLRYPITLWGIGIWQGLNRIQWLLRHGRHRGVLTGLLSAPALIASQRSRRGVLPARSVQSYFKLRRRPEEAVWGA